MLDDPFIHTDMYIQAWSVHEQMINMKLAVKQLIASIAV
jgi:hypothetical protein